MSHLLIRILVVTIISSAIAVATRAGEAVGLHVDDPGRLLPVNPPAVGAIEAKLDNFERTTGRKILVRFQAKSPTPEEDKVPGAYMHALATKLGTAVRGALAVYFADEDDWRVWIGDDSTAPFVGRPGTAKEFTESGAMHDAKEAFLKTALAAGEAAFAAQAKSTPESPAVTRAQRLEFQAEALLDGLMRKLTPR